MLADSDAETAAAIETIAPQLGLDGFAALVRSLQDHRERLASALAHGPAALQAAQRRVLGLGEAESEEDILRAAVQAMDLPHLREVLRRVERNLNKNLEEKVPSG